MSKMARLVECPTCGKEIAAGASVCPNCGAHRNRLPGGCFAFFALFGLLAMLMLMRH